mmetsp:Transcript_30519/g.70794  ORF Transcript_30519/g.70794 Transcript_30519/m.70794 type:complete len:108 (-) Transcript_30519:413-736(-)
MAVLPMCVADRCCGGVARGAAGRRPAFTTGPGPGRRDGGVAECRLHVCGWRLALQLRGRRPRGGLAGPVVEFDFGVVLVVAERRGRLVLLMLGGRMQLPSHRRRGRE